MYKLWAELLGNTEYPVGKRERERERPSQVRDLKPNLFWKYLHTDVTH